MSLRFGSGRPAIYFLICSCTFICSALPSCAHYLFGWTPGALGHGPECQDLSRAGRSLASPATGAAISHRACSQLFRRTNPLLQLRTQESVAALSFGIVPAKQRTN